MSENTKGRPRGWPTLVLIWLPLMVAYAIAIVRFAEIDIVHGLRSAMINSVIASLLGVGVWVLTGRVRWPERPGIAFLAIHLSIALAYSVTWWSLVVLTAAVINGISILGNFREWFYSDTLGWDIFMGLAVYGLAAGVSYALRLRAAVAEERISLAKAEAAVRAAQLSALEARLNPHFLFNTLHSVAALIRERPREAEEAIDTLGELLRESLSEQTGKDRSLGEELAFIDGYLELEQLRMGNRLVVLKQIENEALTQPVPSLILQPLVENAILHGLAPRPLGGTVTIEAQLESDHLLISVADDGVGAESAPDPESSGLGLGIARARISERTPPGEMTITTGTDRGFVVSVKLPLRA